MSKRLSQALKRKAIAWAGQLTVLARSLAPTHVQPAISSHVEERGDDTFIIRVTADRRIAPDARAQEYGSGLKARRGAKEKYPILPKNRRALAFHENANGTWDYDMFDPPMPRLYTPDGRGLFFGVMHPGIQAANEGKGYIAPAMKELRKKARRELDKEVREAILGDLRVAFGKKNK